jgi:UDP-N-acetylmuramate--alanine ligase
MQRLHFVGIGGCGLSGLARLMHERGAHCTGSDSVPSDLTAALQADGIAVTDRQDAEAVPASCDLVIASAAIQPEHPELVEARRRGLTTLTYAEALGRVQADHSGISVAGTHGKSTTAAMLCHILIESGLDPSFIVGATCPQIGGGSRAGAATIPGTGPMAGRPGLLVAEACEFNRSFHHHRPLIASIGNIEEDHLDVYGTLDAIIEAFAEFGRLLPPDGRLLIAHDDAYRRRVTEGLACPAETFGFDAAADYRPCFDAATGRMTLQHHGQPVAAWTNHMPGAHNALNSTVAAVLAHFAGAVWNDIGRALDGFVGLDRRLQRLGRRRIAGGHVTVYDDYGHHPSEIRATLEALRTAERPGRLLCVFQPHQHSRTRFLLEQFADSFEAADVVIVPHIYFVRDTELEKQRVTARDLVDRLRQRGVTAMHLYPFEAIAEQLEILCRDGDLVVIMGAGPVWKVARLFLPRQQLIEPTPEPILDQPVQRSRC